MIDEMATEIEIYENNAKHIRQELIGYDKLKLRNKELKGELKRVNDEYKILNDEYVELVEKHKNMINIIDYKLWDFDNIIDWICTLDDGKYQIYARDLHKNMKKENIRGSQLDGFHKNDLHRLGVTDYGHKKAISKYIKALTKTIKTKDIKKLIDQQVEEEGS